MKVVYDADGWISVHPQKQHIEFTYPMLSILYGLPGSCWKTLGFMMQTCYQYDEEAADFVRGPRPLSVRYIAEGSLQDPSTVVTALDNLRRWRLALQVEEGALASPGSGGEAAVWTVNWRLRVRPVENESSGWYIEGVEEPFVPKVPRACRSVRKIPTLTPDECPDERAENPHVGKIPTLDAGEACGKSAQRSEEDQEKNKNGATPEAAAAVRPTPPVTVTRPALSELERQGYSPDPPTAANRYPIRPSLPQFLPLSLRAMDMTPETMRAAAARAPEEVFPPARYHMDERGAPRPREEAARLWMLAMLGVVTGVQLRTGLDDSAADPLWPLACDLVVEGVTPPQMWVAFGDPAGYWNASEDHAWKRRRPSVAEVKSFWAVAREWRPAAGGGRRATPEATAAAEAGWNAVLQGVRRFGEYRNDELLASLDAVTQAALAAFGGVKRIRAMDVAREGQALKRQFVGEYQSAAARLRGNGEAPADRPAAVREPRPAYAT